MKNLKSNIISNYVGRSWSAILALILVPIYIRYVGIEAYGLIGFFTSLLAVVGILDLGLGNTINRELAISSASSKNKYTQRDLVRTFEIIYWIIAVVAGIIIMFGASFISNNWLNSENIDSETLIFSIQMMAIAVTFRFPMSLYQGGLMGLQKQVLTNKILVFVGTLRGLGAIFVLEFISSTIGTFFIWQAIISLFSSLIFALTLWYNLPESNRRSKFNKDILVSVWRYTAAISANAIVGLLISQIDKILLSKLLSLEKFGYYIIATTVASVIWLIIVPIGQAIFPKFAELYKSNKNELIPLFHKSCQILALILIPVCSILVFFSKEIILIWMGDPLIAQNTYIIVSLLVLGTFLNGLSSITSYAGSAFGWPEGMLYINVAQSIIITPLLIFLVFRLDSLGAAIAWVIINSTYIFIYVPMFFKKFLITEKRKWFLNDTLYPLVIGFSTCALIKFLTPNIDNIFLLTGWIILTGLITLITTGISLTIIRTFFNDSFLKQQ